MRFFRRTGVTLARFWKNELPALIRWPMLGIAVLFSPIWVFVLIAFIPTLLTVAGCLSVDSRSDSRCDLDV